MSGRKRHNFVNQTDQVLRLTGKYDLSLMIPVKQRSDSDRVSCGDQLIPDTVIQNAGILGVEHGEHVRPVFFIHGKQDFTV